MTFKIQLLQVTGPHAQIAGISFDKNPLLIRGPSDTGKSYVMQLVAYCLGSKNPPKEIPENAGYDRVLLEISVDGMVYTIVRGLAGGVAAVYQTAINSLDGASKANIDVSDLIMSASGAASRTIVKKAGTKGVLTAGPLRHWSILSQTTIVKEDSVLGDTSGQTERASALALMLTGNDDAAIEVGASTKDKQAASGGVDAVKDVIRSLQANLPPDTTRVDVEESLSRVDGTLQAISQQQRSRARGLEEVRTRISITSKNLREVETALAQSTGLVSRFNILEKKYQSDLARLIALNEGIALIELLPDVPCPLCGTPIEEQVAPSLAQAATAKKQRKAFEAEAHKIQVLRSGLASTLLIENENRKGLLEKKDKFTGELEQNSREEQRRIESGVEEYSTSASDLAIRRSELFSALRTFDEVARLTVEMQQLEKITKSKAAKVQRALVGDGNAVANHMQKLLTSWGFDSIHQVTFDESAFDMRLNGRQRTSFGMGFRALFLAAYYIAIFEHCMEKKRPHPGVLMIDSPLKNFSDSRDENDPRVSRETVRTRFYAWLGAWHGQGQLIVLENDPPPESVRAGLNILEFVGKNAPSGRPGFFS